MDEILELYNNLVDSFFEEIEDPHMLSELMKENFKLKLEQWKKYLQDNN